MNNNITSILLAAALVAPAAADLTPVPAPIVAPTAHNNMQPLGNCDLLASNTVRAEFVEFRNVSVQKADEAQPTMARVAVFEVIDSLAYRKYVRYGDGQLTSGTRFTIAMNRALPGQPSHIVDAIEQMQPDEEVVMKIDHLYLIGQEGQNIRACSRMARRANAPQITPSTGATPGAAATPAPLPTTVAPLGGAPSPTGVQQSTTQVGPMVIHTQSQSIQMTRTFDAATGQMKTRMFINGVEVDPQTKQPLVPTAAPAPQPAQPTPTNAAEEKAKAAADDNDDTVIDTPAATAPINSIEPITPPAPAPGAASDNF